MMVVVRRSQDYNLMITYNSVGIGECHVTGVRNRFTMINKRYSTYYHIAMNNEPVYIRNMKRSVLVFQSNVPMDVIIPYLGKK